jgi:sister-chromatid-cohesion protein PDS5
MTNLYYGTVKQLLERVASVMVDRESIEHLCQFVKEALEDGPILEELGLQHVGRINPGERGLRLLLVLSFVFPWHFLHADIIRQIISLLSIKREPMVAPLALSVLTFVGKHQPLGDAFPDLLDGLVPICKMFIDKGTPKQAKQAVKCLYMNTTSTQESNS